MKKMELLNFFLANPFFKPLNSVPGHERKTVRGLRRYAGNGYPYPTCADQRSRYRRSASCRRRLWWGYPPRYQKPLDKSNRVEVWHLEEKQTDVNIALQLYRDAVMKNCEQVVLVSSDSDLKPPLELIKHDYSKMNIGLILPRPKLIGSNQRPKNTKLSASSNWTRGYILESELERCQLPNKVPTNKKPITKPDYWWIFIFSCFFCLDDWTRYRYFVPLHHNLCACRVCFCFYTKKHLNTHKEHIKYLI